MMTFFILLQCVLFLFMLLHDFVPVPPFNDIKTLQSTTSKRYLTLGAAVNGGMVLVPLIITLLYANKTAPLWAVAIIFLMYLTLTIGTIFSWWVPYFYGSSEEHRRQFSKFKATHHFLPARGDNVIPNTLHVVLHIQVWLCCLISAFWAGSIT